MYHFLQIFSAPSWMKTCTHGLKVHCRELCVVHGQLPLTWYWKGRRLGQWSTRKSAMPWSRTSFESHGKIIVALSLFPSARGSSSAWFPGCGNTRSRILEDPQSKHIILEIHNHTIIINWDFSCTPAPTPYMKLTLIGWLCFIVLYHHYCFGLVYRSIMFTVPPRKKMSVYSRCLPGHSTLFHLKSLLWMFLVLLCQFYLQRPAIWEKSFSQK